jgi:hypothetical protein
MALSGACAIGRFSSFHRDVTDGLFPQDWAGDFGGLGEFGEAVDGAIK